MILLLSAILLHSLSPVGGGETGAEALQSRNYQRAAELLHTIVAAPEYAVRAQDPEPARQLAVLYAQGLGVPRDPIAACTLARTAAIAARSAAPKYAGNTAAYDASLEEGDRFIQEHCGGLSTDDQRSAALSIGCHAFAMPEEVLPVGGQLVRVGRSGIGVLDAPEARIVGLLNCPLYIARVRTTSVEPPRDAAPGVKARHVIEVFSWGFSDRPDETRLYSLRWHAYELHGDRIVVGAFAEVQPAATWPHSLVPPDLDTRVSLDMNLSGQVRCQVDGDAARRGWLRVPE